MPISCTPNDLANASRCFCGFSKREADAAAIFSICQWASNIKPVEPTISWTPPSEIATWHDSTGNHSGDLSAFLATLPNPTLDRFRLLGGGVTSVSNLYLLGTLDILDINSNLLTSIDLTGCQVDTVFLQGNTFLTTVIGATSLGASCTQFFIQNCDLSSLDLSGLSNLVSLRCDGNPNMTALTLTGCASLTTLLCYNCNITGTLDVSPCAPALTTLNCSSNPSLTTLTLTGCTGLTSLDCSTCDITGTLDLSPCTSVNQVFCYTNPNLTSLTLTGLNSLVHLESNDCDITGTLDASPCVLLDTLVCYSNANLTAITLTGLTVLTTLRFQSCNVPGNIDLSALTSLSTVECYSNANLTGLVLTGLVLLTYLDCSTCSMNQASVDNVLCTMDTNGALNGSLFIVSNSVPSAAGLVCSANLDPGKGWTVTHD